MSCIIIRVFRDFSAPTFAPTIPGTSVFESTTSLSNDNRELCHDYVMLSAAVLMQGAF